MTIPTNRRTFIQLSASALLLAAPACREPRLELSFPLDIDASLLRAHRLFEREQALPPRGIVRKQTLIVGGGIAGLAAAAKLAGQDLVVCEVGAHLGGSSSATLELSGQRFAQGAHYELPYPATYGSEVLAFLEELGLIGFNNASALWEFTAKEYLIEEKLESRTWTPSGSREDPIPHSEAGQRFAEVLADFDGKMPLPTRLIKQQYHSYDQMTFAAWLDSVGLSDAALREGIDYQMRDDYGAGSDQVSALAGIHYYRCRPYYHQTMLHFSPPQGNAYFIEQMALRVPLEALRVDHLVTAIRKEEGPTLLVDVLDLKANQWHQFRVDQVVYAGQKHALKYIHPADAGLFAHNRYAPWMSIQFHLGRYPGKVFWQNEVVGADPAFLGFVNSAAQYGTSPEQTVLTAYLCLDEFSRAELVAFQKEPLPLLERTLRAMNRASGKRLDRLVTRASVKLHGHAMPIPVPGYLFRDGNQNRSLPNLVYAGVDNGRLPLLFEALDSGLMAASLVC